MTKAEPNPLMAENCVPFEEFRDERGPLYQWNHPEIPGRKISTRDAAMVPLRPENQRKLDDYTDAHLLAVAESGIGDHEPTGTQAMDGYDKSFARELAARGYSL